MIERTSRPDQAWQALAAAPARHEAVLGMLIAEAGRRAGKCHVGGEHEFQPSGQAQSLDSGNDRQRTGFERRQFRMSAGDELCRGIAVFAGGLDLVEIGAGAEVLALGADQDCADGLVGSRSPHVPHRSTARFGSTGS